MTNRNVHTLRGNRRGRLPPVGVTAATMIAVAVLLTCDSSPSLTVEPGTVDSVVVQPRSLDLHVGDSVQFDAWGIAPNGDSVGAPLTWFATGGRIDSTGRYQAPTASGVYTVKAVYGFQVVGWASVTVRPPDSLLAGIVIEPHDTSASGGDTVRFTVFARYTIGRRMPVTPLFQAQGGDMRSDGLFTAGEDPGTFLVVAADPGGRFRDTARVTIRAPAVASVTLTPAAVSVPAGRSVVLDALMRGADGDTLVERAASWSSATPGIATVLPATGLVTGLTPGEAVITATSEGQRGSATVTVTAADSGAWPHEPVGFSLISDTPWDLLTALDWDVQFGTATIGVDPLAPFSPPNVLTITYPIGFVAGEAPGTLTHQVPGVRSLYMGIWWKVSDPWQGHESNVNKIAFVFPDGGGDIFLAMYGPPGGPYELRVIPQFPGQESDWLRPNVHNVPVTLGVWHHLEWLLVYNTSVGPPNGVSRWWMDGVLIGDHQNVLFPDGPMSSFKLSPTWGGVGGPNKTELDFYWYDHTRLSGR